MENKKVIILTGPGGSGKTTIANLLEKNYGFAYVDGDRIDTEFFPNGNQWLPENSSNLQKAHEKILRYTEEAFDRGENVVIDYIIFGDYLGFINKAKNLFGPQLEIKVLFPSEEETLKRDTDRTSWHTGIDRIRAVRKEFELIKNQIGTEAFIDTTEQTPEETFSIYFNNPVTTSLIERHWPLTAVQLGSILQVRHERVVREIVSEQGKYIYKIAHPIKTSDTLVKDTAVFDVLTKQGFEHIPKLLKTKDGKDFLEVQHKFIYILEFIEGKYPKENLETYKKLGEIVADLHAVKNYPYTTDFKASGIIPDLRKNSESYMFGAEYRKVLDQLPNFDEFPQALIHTDIGIGNAIEKDDGNIILIDWDDVGVGTRILDLGVVAINLFIGEDLKYKKEYAEAFFHAYLLKQTLTPEEIDHIFDAGLFFALMYIPYGAGLEKRWKRIEWAIENRKLLEQAYQH